MGGINERHEKSIEELYSITREHTKILEKHDVKLESFEKNCQARKEAEEKQFENIDKVADMKLELMAADMRGMRACIEDNTKAFKEYIAAQAKEKADEKKCKEEEEKKKPGERRAIAQLIVSIVSMLFGSGVVLLIFKYAGVIK